MTKNPFTIIIFKTVQILLHRNNVSAVQPFLSQEIKLLTSDGSARKEHNLPPVSVTVQGLLNKQISVELIYPVHHPLIIQEKRLMLFKYCKQLNQIPFDLAEVVSEIRFFEL